MGGKGVNGGRAGPGDLHVSILILRVTYTLLSLYAVDVAIAGGLPKPAAGNRVTYLICTRRPERPQRTGSGRVLPARPIDV